MKDYYVLNTIPHQKNVLLCSQLHYKCSLKRLLENHRITNPAIQYLLLDTALGGNGFNPYRFVRVAVNEEGYPEFENFSYERPDRKTRLFADQILQSYPDLVRNSPLSAVQTERLFEDNSL